MTKLSQYLEAHHITQADLARRSGVNRRTIVTACHAQRDVSLDTWAKLARALGCNVYEISEDAYSRVVGTV